MFETLQRKTAMQWGGVMKEVIAYRHAAKRSSSSFHYEEPVEDTEEPIRDPIVVEATKFRNAIVHRYDLVPCLEHEELWHCIVSAFGIEIATQESKIGCRIVLDSNVWHNVPMEISTPAVQLLFFQETRTEPVDLFFSFSKFAAKLDFKWEIRNEFQPACLVFAIDNYATMIQTTFESVHEQASHIHARVFDPPLPTIGSLSPQEEVIDFIFDLIRKKNVENVYSGDYVYSMSVVSPINIIRKVNSERLAELVPKRWLFSCMRGQIPHEVIYSIAPDDLRQVLREVLSHCAEVEVSVCSEHHPEVARTRFSLTGRA